MIEQEKCTNAVLDMLRRGTGRPVGDHKAPKREINVADAEYFPYCILYSIPGTIRTGSLKDPWEDAELIYQVTSVGLRRDQCEWMADRVRLTWLARTASGAWQVHLVSTDGWAPNGRIPLDGFSGGIDMEGDPPHEVFSYPERFVLQVTPEFSE